MRPIRPALAVALPILLLAVACGDDAIQTGEGDLHGTVRGTVDYAGAAVVQRLAVAVFDQPAYPPKTMPVAMAYVPDEPVAAGLTFPASYEVGALPEGDLWYMVYGDVDPTDGPLPKTIDPASAWVGPVTITATTPAFEEDLTLEDGRWQGLDTDVSGYFDGVEPEVVDDVATDPGPADVPADLTPQAGRATLYGTVTYAGAKSGKLVVIGFKDGNFDTMPTILPPFTAEGASFPFDYAIPSVFPTTKVVFAYLDVDPADGMTNTGKDPVSAPASVDLAAGDVVRVDLELIDP